MGNKNIYKGSRNKYPRMPKEIRNPLRCFPIPIQIYPRFTLILTGVIKTFTKEAYQEIITPLLCGEFSGFCIEKKDMHVKILEHSITHILFCPGINIHGCQRKFGIRSAASPYPSKFM